MLYLLFPLVAAIVFATGNLCFKRAFAEGAGLTRVLFVSNFLLGLALAPLFFFETKPVIWTQLPWVALAGLVFFAGNVANAMAVRVGDVTVATPIMGMKVVLVAALSAGLFGVELRPGYWISACLTTLGVFLLGVTDLGSGSRAGLTTILALISATCFALCDVLIQRWASQVGIFNFIPGLFLTVSLLSCSAVPFFRGPLSAIPRPGWKWLLIGIALTAAQALLITGSIGIWKDATGVNVVYSTRGLWSILLVWFVGHWFGNTEKSMNRRRMAWRTVGAGLITAAVFIVLRHG